MIFQENHKIIHKYLETEMLKEKFLYVNCLVEILKEIYVNNFF